MWKDEESISFLFLYIFLAKVHTIFGDNMIKYYKRSKKLTEEKKVKNMSKDIYKQIRSLRNKLHNSIEKNGLNAKETRLLSNKIDKLINEYYENIKEIEYPEFSETYINYKKSYEALKSVTQQLQRFPSVFEWNKYAKENNCLSHISLEYISKLNWNYLQIRVEREINLKI